MKITRSSDWRSALPFETPMIAATVMPGDAARCVTCGVASEPLPRTQLWAVKHRHPHDPAGSVRLYCAAHTPKAVAVRDAASRPSRAAAAPRAARVPRAERVARPKVPERPALVCPNCFMEVPASGICGVCGQQVG